MSRKGAGTSKQSNTKARQIRIIAGDWRGRKLPVPEAEGLRPTQDHIRETLFNWLAFDIAGAYVLDLFAGTGALGLEALSRGAAKVDFVDTNPKAVQQLRSNLSTLGSAAGQIHHQSALDYIKQAEDNSYDLIFLDPPFHKDWLKSLFAEKQLSRVLKPGGKVYIEYEKGAQFSAELQLIKEKSTGSLIFSLYES